MAKLDKQGLNTFIRELDKHINTKLNRLGKTPIAENIKMADGTSVEDMVSANKTGISSLNSEIDATNNNLTELKTKVNNGQNFKVTQDTGNSILLPVGYDINNLRTDSGKGTAHYYGANLTNCPYTGYCHVENIRLGSNGDYQKVMQMTTGLKQERYYYNGWQPWREL